MTDNRFPIYETGSGWNALLPPREVRLLPPRDRSFPTIVIGAGYVGLAASRRLAELEPGRQILLLEAGDIGEGASARNSGFLGVAAQQPLAHGGDDAPTAAARQIRLYRAGLAWLKSLVAQNAIDCDWNEDSLRVMAAATPAGAKRVAESLARYQAWGIAARAMAHDELQRRLGTAYYQAGMTYGDYAFVQPAALVRGLADCLPAEVTLVERMPVAAVTGTGPFQVNTSAGAFTADRLVIASNVHARNFGLLAGRMFAIYTYGGLTPPLPPDECAKLGADASWGVLPAHKLGSTSRKISGGRLLIRSGDSYESQLSAAKIRDLLSGLYRHRYPQMQSHDLQHVWSGVTAITGNGGLYFGEPRKGVFCVAGCNGSGVVRGSINGKLLAEMACGSQSDLLSDRLRLKGPNWIPPEPLRRIGVQSTIAIERIFAGPEI